ncbi:MAG: DUF2383 domain-containing protein [Kofleriaceae bacterium]
MDKQPTNETRIDQLNSFLRGELSAVETYRQALDKLDRDSPARATLETCQRSHADRVDLLRDRVASLGGKPADGSGAWGVFAKITEGGAALLGDKMAISALEEGEDHGLKNYRDDLDKYEPSARAFVTAALLPKQEQTHRVMSNLKRQLAQN